MPAPFYTFGDFELDSARFELRSDGRPLKLERIPLELLILLVERGGQVVSRQEIVERLWGRDVFVDTEHGINTAIRKIRAALREDVDRPRFIQTVSGKGYRFVPEAKSADPAQVASELAVSSGVQESVIPTSPRKKDQRFWQVAVISGVVLFVVAAIFALDVSGDASQDYYADGMTGELITALAHNQSLRVVSRTSIMQSKGAKEPLRDIAQALAVDGILEGSVNRSGNQVHVNLQLIYAPTDTHLWAQSCDRDLSSAMSRFSARFALIERMGLQPE